MQNTTVVDIFCGVGGLTHGFVKEGFHVAAGVDIDETCRYPYEYNNNTTFVAEDVATIDIAKISALYPEKHIKILVGCAPCQPFSGYSKKTGLQNAKWQLVEKFADLIVAVNPDVVSMENVPELLKFNNGAVFRAFETKLQEAGYTTNYSVVYCPDYGIPQKRNRLVFFASKYGKVDLVSPTHTKENYKTVKDTIGHLPAIKAGGVDKKDRLHQASRLSKLNLRRIRQSTPGGTWHDWKNQNLVAKCHKEDTGKGYSSVYGRMSWDEPSPTMTTQCYGYGNGRFGHPKQNRAISLREAALLQTFPSDYEFVSPEESVAVTTVGTHIGNAVPVDLGKVIARTIREHLEEHCIDN